MEEQNYSALELRIKVLGAVIHYDKEKGKKPDGVILMPEAYFHFSRAGVVPDILKKKSDEHPSISLLASANIKRIECYEFSEFSDKGKRKILEKIGGRGLPIVLFRKRLFRGITDLIAYSLPELP